MFHAEIFVNRMEFDETKWSFPWNSDQNCTQNSAKGWWGSAGVGAGGVQGVGVQGVQGGRGGVVQGEKGW